MSRKQKYKATKWLNHNESLAIVNTETGEIMEDKKSSARNIPEGMSKLGYADFGMINNDAIKVLSNPKYFSEVDVYVIIQMIGRCDFCSNSLAPLNNATSQIALSDAFKVSRKRLVKSLENLYEMGVYLELSVVEDGRERNYWVLNPNIFWKGRLTQDSIFHHFRNTDITKLIVN